MDLRPFMERWGMLPSSGGTMLVAVSGGRDSVCLLHYLATMPRDFSVAAAHLDHGQRPTAGRDVAFVRQLCRELDVPLTVERADVPALARQRGVGLEEAGRMARYDFFRRTADSLGAQRIATAHHAADQAETVLLNLVRGTGMQGLAGIPPVRGRIVRPLLETSRDDIETYLKTHGLSHVEDETNRDTSLGRNRLRREVMPGLLSLHPGAAASICRTAELLRREDAFLDSLAAAYLPREGLSASRERLLSAPEVLRLRALRLLAGRLPVGKKDFTAAHYRAMAELLEGGGMTALETAEFMAERKNTIVLCEMMPQFAADTFIYRVVKTQLGLARQGVCMKPHTMVLGANEEGVLYRDLVTGLEGVLPAEVIVLSLGVRPDRTLRAKLDEAFDNVVVLGDSNKTGTLQNATGATFHRLKRI